MRHFYAELLECTGVLRLQRVSAGGLSETKLLLSVTYLARSGPSVSVLSDLCDQVRKRKKKPRKHQFVRHSSEVEEDNALCSYVLLQVYLIRPGEHTLRELSSHWWRSLVFTQLAEGSKMTSPSIYSRVLQGTSRSIHIFQVLLQCDAFSFMHIKLILT